MTEILTHWPILIALICTGIAAGILAGLLGVGGGIVIVPVLYFLLPQFGVSYESAMVIATATSLATIVPTAISSIKAHHKKGNIDQSLLFFWAGFIAIAAVLGSLLANQLKGQTLTILFGVIAILVSCNMLFRAGARPLFQQLPAKPLQALLASFVGSCSVMIGIGGGTLGVPILSSFNVSAHRAVGTAAAFGLIIALTGVITLIITGVTPTDAPFGTVGLINLPAFCAIVPLTVLFAPVGVKIGSLMNQQQLKKCFAVALMITGSRMLYSTLGG